MPDADPNLSPLCDGDPLARALAALKPVPVDLATPHFLYQAGSAARERTVSFWRWAFLAQSVVMIGVIGVGLLLWPERPTAEPVQPTPPPVVPVTEVTPELAPMPRPSPESGEPSGGNGYIAHEGLDAADVAEQAYWLRQRNDILTAGLGLVPPPTRPSEQNTIPGLIWPRGVYAIPPSIPSKPEPSGGPE